MSAERAMEKARSGVVVGRARGVEAAVGGEEAAW
jgi:hypothetical protein